MVGEKRIFKKLRHFSYERDLLKQEIGFEAALEANIYIYTYLNRCLNTSSLINNFIKKNENSVGILVCNDV